eukprot:15432359-Alexandrium_andersonii.AAC.1
MPRSRTGSPPRRPAICTSSPQGREWCGVPSGSPTPLRHPRGATRTNSGRTGPARARSSRSSVPSVVPMSQSAMASCSSGNPCPAASGPEPG